MPVADIRPALRTFLLADASISTAVGGARVYPVVLPQGQRLASIVYNRISGEGFHHMQGASRLAKLRMQIDAYAPQADDASALADLIKERIDGYRGAMGSVTVQGVFYDTERDDYQPDVDLHRASRDYLIVYEEQ